VDHAGNNADAVSVGYTVVYRFTGFLQPVDNSPVVNVTAVGKAIPGRFRRGGNDGLSVLAPGYPQSQSMACSSTTRCDPIEQTVSARSSSLR
jgi:hypothetical protein